MQDLFIKDDEEFTINFTVAIDKKGVIFCDIDRESLAKSIDVTEDMKVEDYHVIFKRPSFGDNLELYAEIFTANGENSINFNPMLIRLNKMVSLIKSWNLKGKNEKPSEKEIRALNPIISLVIGIQLDNHLGDEFL